MEDSVADGGRRSEMRDGGGEREKVGFSLRNAKSAFLAELDPAAPRAQFCLFGTSAALWFARCARH